MTGGIPISFKTDQHPVCRLRITDVETRNLRFTFIKNKPFRDMGDILCPVVKPLNLNQHTLI